MSFWMSTLVYLAVGYVVSLITIYKASRVLKKRYEIEQYMLVTLIVTIAWPLFILAIPIVSAIEDGEESIKQTLDGEEEK